MKIGVIAPPWLPVPPNDYGGTELIVDILCRGYQQAGHEVVLYCSSDSTCPVEQRSVISRGTMPPDKYQEHQHFGYCLEDIPGQNFDIIHSHLEGFIPYAPTLNTPVVCTVHVPVTEQRLPLLDGNKAFIVAISHDHAATFNHQPHVVYNGLELDRYSSEATAGEHLIWIGAISPEKGIERSLQLAVSSGSRLVIAGMLKQEQQSWFDRLLEYAGDNVVFIGPVGFRDKVDLLTSAKALLMPVSWREPFGLVAVEAMACGTPVIATRRGSLPELIVDGVNGYICDDDGAMEEALDKVEELDRTEIRNSVRERFSAERMVGEYLELFERIKL